MYAVDRPHEDARVAMVKIPENHIVSILWTALPMAIVSSQQTYAAIITSLLPQNDVATSFWRNNNVIIAPQEYWDTTNALIIEHSEVWTQWSIFCKGQF